jgi:peroxiredoxin
MHPQSCGFRDIYSEFQENGFKYTELVQRQQNTKEFVSRNHIPFEILSDADFKLTNSIKLPTFMGRKLPLLQNWVGFLMVSGTELKPMNERDQKVKL